MGCASSSAIEVTEHTETPNAPNEGEEEQSSTRSRVEEAPGSPQAVAAAASKLRSEVEAQSAAERKRLQAQRSSGQLEQREADAELRLRGMEEALDQLLKLIESQKCSGADEASFDVHVPPLEPEEPAPPDDPALPVALSDNDAAALKAALAHCDEEANQSQLLETSRLANDVKATPSEAPSGHTRVTTAHQNALHRSPQRDDETIDDSSDFGDLDPDVVSSSSLLRLNGILKRLDALELQAAFDANGGMAG